MPSPGHDAGPRRRLSRAVLRFVLCDGPGRGLETALASRADGVILDLAGRAGPVGSTPWDVGPACLVRLSSPWDAGFDGELDAAMALHPARVLARGTGGLSDLEHVAARLAVAEARHGLDDGAVGIVALADDPRAVQALRTLRPTPRLRGVAFDPGALALALACGADAATLAVGAAEAVLAAASCGVPSLVVLSSDHWRERARREGFSGVIETIKHPFGLADPPEPDRKHSTSSF
jgi:hypothetical protein